MTHVHSAEPAARPQRDRPYVPSLDGLRGVAILGVLLFHTGHLSGGFLGVDLFFVLSGYLITDLLVREAERSGRVSLTRFWGRRLRRLLPALAVMLGCVTVLVWAFEAPSLVQTTLSDGPWVLLNVLNWHLLAESAGYWDRFGSDRVFEHLWSIAVEEQFYLVWPVVVLVLARWRHRVSHRVAVVAVLASVGSLLLMMLLHNPADPSRVYTGTDTRAFALLLGALVACYGARAGKATVGGRWASPLSALLAVGLGASWFLVDGVGTEWLFPGGLLLHSLAAALLIGLCVQLPQTWTARALAWGPLRWLGTISYSLYLWHWPVIVLLSPTQTGLDGWPHTVVVCVVSVGLAALSKYLVEDPIRFHARWARGRSGLLVLAALVVSLLLLWLALPAPPPIAIDLTELS
ncbi:acyltransferase family protein [Actinoalloteichus hymeniacidonis]|nr:acyltransferase [Actinoalloteichus hymeniacidonis]MBB5910044.1 peptidoglycan/LPS O-acetylase OafA/YrhL [Actinoalloteichus hymeniacidonis]